MDFTILNSIENMNSRTDKIELLKKNMNDELETFFRMVFDDVKLDVADRTISNALDMQKDGDFADIGMKVSHFLNKRDPLTPDWKWDSFGFFMTLYDSLQTIKGQAAQDRIRAFFLNCCTHDEAKWYARCLIKNLRCGIMKSNINKVFIALDKQVIGGFAMALCQGLDCENNKTMTRGIEKILARYKPIIIQPKYDGIRAVVNTINTPVVYTRNGRKITSLPYIHEDFQRAWLGLKCELDCEITSTQGYNHLMSIVQKKEPISRKDYEEYIRVNVFDAMTLDNKNIENCKHSIRRGLLVRFTKKTVLIGNRFRLVDEQYASSPDIILHIYRCAIASGYEGIVLKANSPYIRSERKRDIWFKMKPIKTADLLVYGALKGTGKNAEKISSLMLRDASGIVMSKVGIGITDDTINQITEKSCIGRIAEIAYDNITSAKDGKQSLRFPRFIGFREDKTEPDNLRHY